MTGVGDVSADAWFAQATRRINLVKEVADATAGDIVQRAERVAQAASRTFTLFSLLIAGLVVIAAALGALVVRRMIPLRAVTERLRALALGDSSFDRIEAQGRDEVGELQTAYNAFVVGLAKLVSRGETLAQGAVDTTPITDGMAAGLGFSEAAAAAARRATSTPEGADLSVQGPLATAFQTLETSQAQLALQAQTIARDDLTHPLLTVRLEGSWARRSAT